MIPPPPPPPPGARSGPPPPMPPQLQDMMRQMQQRQPKFQQQQRQQGGRGRGRGRGRGSQQRQGRGHKQSQFKRKRGPSDDVRDASRFFLPSFLEDPWKHLLREESRGQADVAMNYGRQEREMRPQQVPRQYATQDGPGRVFFQPSFLEDPWAQSVR